MPKKLTMEDAEMIRLLYENTGATISAIAREYGMGTDAISDVVNRKSFTGRPQPPKHNRKFSDWEIREMRRLRAAGGSSRKIARAMGLPESDHGSIESVVRGDTYREVR